jgi:hypothetical protein
MSLAKTADQLIKNMMSDTLTYEELRNFYHTVLNRFDEIENFDTHTPFQQVGNLFTLMLEIENFEDDQDILQTIAAIGYYVLCKGMERFGLETNGHFKIGAEFAQIELIAPRISILLEGKMSIKYCLYDATDDIDEFITPFNFLNKESLELGDMILSDSYIVKHLCSMGMNSVFYSGAYKQATEVYNKYSSYGDIAQRIENGRNSQIRLYNHLKNKFENERTFKF